MSIGDVKLVGEPASIHARCPRARQGCALLAQLVSLVHRFRTALLLNACALPRQPFPNTPSSSKQTRNSKSRMIPSGGLLDKTDKRQIQPVQGLMACTFLVYYQMELRKHNSHLLIFFVCCEQPKVTGSLFFCGLPLKCRRHQCSAGPHVEGPIWSESVGGWFFLASLVITFVSQGQLQSDWSVKQIRFIPLALLKLKCSPQLGKAQTLQLYLY